MIRSSPPTAFAEVLLRWRSAAGLSQRELALRAGLSVRAVRDLETGTTARPRRHSVTALAEALGLTGDDLTAFRASISWPATEPEPARTSFLDDFVGRERELRALWDLVVAGRNRILTVVGRAGLGKSRFAAELVGTLRRHGTWDVRTLDLSGLRDPDLVGELIAEAFGCGGASRLSFVDRLAPQLGDRRAVLLLDGFERLIAAGAQVAALVSRCPGLTVLITSQQPLRLSGERQMRLGPLPESAAVALFRARATAAGAPASNPATVAHICRRLEGLPLAIELAAARTRLLSAGELLHRLNRPLAVLSDGPRDRPTRHRSLRAAIEASLEPLSDEARTLFTWLGAFTGEATLDDVESVAAALGASDWLLTAFNELIGTGLVRSRIEVDRRWHSLPDAVGELALDHLSATSGQIRVRRAVAAHYLGRVRQHASSQGRPLEPRDADNVRAAFAWATSEDLTLVDAATTDALMRYYEVSGRLAEGQAMFERAGGVGQPRAWVRAGQLARMRGDLAAAMRLGDVALQRLDAGDHGGRGLVSLMLGSVNTDRRNARQARAHLHGALVHGRHAGDLDLIVKALNNLGTLSMEFGRLNHAERLLNAAYEGKRRAGRPALEVGRTQFNRAETALAAGRAQVAIARATDAMALLRTEHPRLAGFAATTRALALLRLGDVSGALATSQAAMTLLARDSEDLRMLCISMTRHSVVLHAAGHREAAAGLLAEHLPAALTSTVRDRDDASDRLAQHAELLAGHFPHRAAVLLGIVQRLRESSDVAPGPDWAGDRVARVCRQLLDASTLAARLRAGRELPSADVAAACAELVADARPVPASEGGSGRMDHALADLVDVSALGRSSAPRTQQPA